MAVRHNAKHQFQLGCNNSNELNLAVPFPTCGQQGWKWIYETFATGRLYTADSNPYELTVLGVTPAPVPAANGVLIPSLAGDNTSTHLQWTTPTVQLGVNTKKFFLETSVTVTATDMAQNEIYIGFTTDVLEHVEEIMLNKVLNHLRELTGRFLYNEIACYYCGITFGDGPYAGQDLHINMKCPDVWSKRLQHRDFSDEVRLTSLLEGWKVRCLVIQARKAQ